MECSGLSTLSFNPHQQEKLIRHSLDVDHANKTSARAPCIRSSTTKDDWSGKHEVFQSLQSYVQKMPAQKLAKPNLDPSLTAEPTGMGRV